ncbi:MAG: hypothetical protein RIB67_07560 [Miltoncostaeaceae bacterium]
MTPPPRRIDRTALLRARRAYSVQLQRRRRLLAECRTRDTPAAAAVRATTLDHHDRES